MIEVAITDILEGLRPTLALVNSTYTFQGNFLRSMNEKRSAKQSGRKEENYLKDILEFLSEDPEDDNVNAEFIPMDNAQTTQGINETLAQVRKQVPFTAAKISIKLTSEFELNYEFNTLNQGTFYTSRMPQQKFKFKFRNEQLFFTLGEGEPVFKFRSKVNAVTNAVDIFGRIEWEDGRLSFKYTGKLCHVLFRSQKEQWKFNFKRLNNVFSVLLDASEIPDDVVWAYVFDQIKAANQIRDYLITRQVLTGRITFSYSRYDMREDGLPEVDAIVILPKQSLNQVNEIEEDYFTYLESLKENGVRDLGVTFWNE